MNDAPFVTVAIPVFNGEKYIDMAINSTLCQTYTNFELIILDDGSSDRTLEIVKEFKDPRIRVLSDGNNRGLTYRLNESVKIARGQFYTRMDADDVMVATRLEEQIKYLLQNPECDVVGSAAYIIDGENRLTGIRSGNPSIGEGFLSILKHGVFIHPTVTGHTDWFLNNPYSPYADRCEDTELWLRTADQANFKEIKRPLLFYREAGDQSAKVEKSSAGYRNVLRSLIQTVRPEYRPLVQKQLRHAHVKIWVRRVAHKLGLEKQIVAARSQRLTEDQRQAGEAALQQALVGSSGGL